MYVDNWHTLCVAILREVTPETAYRMLDGECRYNSCRYNSELTEYDMGDMMDMQNGGMSLKEIGVMYGLSDNNVGHRIKRYKIKKGIYAKKETEISKIRKLLDSGKSLEQVAEIYGVSKSSIFHRLKKHKGDDGGRNEGTTKNEK